MKSIIALFMLVALSACATEPTSPEPTKPPEDHAAVVKERDALKLELEATKLTLANTKKETQAYIQSFQEQVQNLSNQLATSQANLKLTILALQEAQKPKP